MTFFLFVKRTLNQHKILLFYFGSAQIHCRFWETLKLQEEINIFEIINPKRNKHLTLQNPPYAETHVTEIQAMWPGSA
jgi:hypothetical protein